MTKKLVKAVKYIGTSAAVAQAFVVSAFAQTSADEFIGSGNISNQAGGDLIGWVQGALNLVIGLTGLIAVGILVYSAIQYIIAAGDESKIDKATKGIIYSIVGLIIAFISVLIVNFVIGRVIGA